MEKVIDLKDLLKHEITDLYSAEEQIIEALPLMIEKAGNAKLKAALEDHLKVTENQKSRLDQVKQLLTDEALPESEGEGEGEKVGFFSRLFGGGEEKCKGMEGLISEGKKVMSIDMSPEACDAAIIASAQKIEHYEISGYGTARAFARELNLGEVAHLLEQTLNEEYDADDLLTDLAIEKINVDAEFAVDAEKSASPARRPRPRPIAKPTFKPPVKSGGKNAAPKKINKGVAVKKLPAKKLPAKKSPAKKTPAKLSSLKSSLRSPLKSNLKSPSKSSAVKNRTAPAKGKSFKATPTAKAPAKVKPAVKKVAVKSSKGGNSKSPLKSKSSRRR